MKTLSYDTFFNTTHFQHKNLFEGIAYPWEALKKIKAYLTFYSLGKIEGRVELGATLIHPELISIGKGTIVEAGAYIIGPCIIGDYCEIRHTAYLRGDVIIGNHCVVGHATEIKNSILLNGAKAGHFAYVGDSILGNECNLGAGTKLANLRFDKKEIHVFIEAQKIETGLRKFGAIIGDFAQTGCNSVTNPGTLMGKGKTCSPCVNIGGFF